MKISCLTLCSVAGWLACAPPASADPVRITVTFTVAGDNIRDPDLGSAVSSGSLSVVTTLGPGDVQTRYDGFSADHVLFTWGGTTWTEKNADVVQIGFDDSGEVSLWTLGAATNGEAGVGSSTFPDFLLGYCGFCSGDPFTFSYTTPRSPLAGIFSGRLTSFQLTTEPAPTPEPLSMMLVGTGLAGLALMRRRRLG